MHRSSLPFIVAILLVFGLSLSAQNPPSPQQVQMTAEKWRADLKFMAAEIERVHKNAFHKVSRDEFYSAVNALDAKIPSLENHQVAVEIMRLVAMIGDGHTGVRWGSLAANGVLPVIFYPFEDGIYVRRIAPEHSSALGSKLIKIGDRPVQDAIQILTPYMWLDNEMGIKSALPWYLATPRILHAVGLSASKESAKFTVLKDGRETVIEPKQTGSLGDLQNPPAAWLDARKADVKVPLWLKEPRNNFWFEIVPETKTLYVQFNAVQNKPEETVEAFFNKVFDTAEKQPVERLVIDLRHNGGGNNYLNRPITIGAIRSRLNVKGKFFVITSRETFSAAQNTVNDLEKYTNAIFVGEPTGASPNHYGDARPIILPNSQIRLQASELWWQDKDPRDTRKWTAPAVAADLTFEHYRDGRDPAMEAILAYKPAQSMREIIAEARAKNDVAGLISKYKLFKANPAHKYEDTMTPLNQVGHFLLGANQADSAMEIFKINAADNPDSAVVYQSLADGYAIKGDKTAALENYKKAVKINPKLTASVEAIKRLSSN